MSFALRLTGVKKAYGRNQALAGLDLEIPKGVVCGLVGPNGAGKTTTFGVVGGVLEPDEGSVDLLGLGPFDPALHGGRVTLLPQDCELNPHTSVGDLLVFYGRLQGMSRDRARKEAERCLDLVDLGERRQHGIKQLSHGMRRRVAVAQALLGEPELVLLDEPTSGLDPDQVVRLRDVFRAQRGQRTLIISSHILSELEAACDFVVMMELGRRVLQGSMEEVTRVGHRVTYVHRGELDLGALRGALPDLSVELDGVLVVQGPPGVEVGAINRAVLPWLLAHDVEVLEVRRGQSLEQRWLDERG